MDASMVLRQDTTSAGLARRFVRDMLSQWRLDQFAETATLLISELVTNAVLHAHCAPEVILSADRGVFRAVVVDASPVQPARRSYGPDAGTGRGILLVEAMASEWGVEQRGTGKCVWFELAPGHEDDQMGGIALDAETLADLSDLSGLAGMQQGCP